MTQLTPPSSQANTPARPTTPPFDPGMDVDSTPASPTPETDTPIETPVGGPTDSPVGTPGPRTADPFSVRRLGSDTEPEAEAGETKNRQKDGMLDAEVVARWNKEIRDPFAAKAKSPAP